MRKFNRKNSIFNKNISFSNRNSSINYKRIIRLILILVIIIFLAVLFKKCKNYICSCEKFEIETIEITGCKNVTQVEIIELVPFKTGDNLFRVDLSDAEEKIKILKPELKDITMLRRWKRVLIKLKERQPEVFIPQGETLVGLDFDNISFGLRGHMFEMKIPVLSCSSKEERLSLLEFVKLLKPHIKDFIHRITEIKYGEVNDIIFIIDGKTTVYWGDFYKNEIKNKAKRMLVVFEDASQKYANIEYIDLRFLEKDKVIVKPAAPEADAGVIPEGSV